MNTQLEKHLQQFKDYFPLNKVTVEDRQLVYMVKDHKTVKHSVKRAWKYVTSLGLPLLVLDPAGDTPNPSHNTFIIKGI